MNHSEVSYEESCLGVAPPLMPRIIFLIHDLPHLKILTTYTAVSNIIIQLRIVFSFNCWDRTAKSQSWFKVRFQVLTKISIAYLPIGPKFCIHWWSCYINNTLYLNSGIGCLDYRKWFLSTQYWKRYGHLSINRLGRDDRSATLYFEKDKTDGDKRKSLTTLKK